jgi:tryptophan 2,3-dioxygenase
VLGHGSGFDSPGFRQIRHVSTPLYGAFDALRRERGLSLRQDEHPGRELKARRERGRETEEHEHLVEWGLDRVRSRPIRSRRIRAQHVVVRDEPIESQRFDLTHECGDDVWIAPDLGLGKYRVQPHRLSIEESLDAPRV